jgi:hypothetical protein
MKITVGVMGSSGGSISRETRRKAYALGKEIAQRGCVLLTGACPGVPYHATRGCKEAGGFTVGVSPALSLQEHITRYQSPWRHFDVLIYTGDGLMGREITAIRSCDITVLIAGRSGTLGEFAIAYDEGRIIGALQGTGGVADGLSHILDIVGKETGAEVISDADPARLLDRLLAAHRRRKGRLPDRTGAAG